MIVQCVDMLAYITVRRFKRNPELMMGSQVALNGGNWIV